MVFRSKYLQFIEKTFCQGKGACFIVEALPLSFQSVRKKEKEKTIDEIKKRTNKVDTLDMLKSHTKDEFYVKIIAYFDKYYDNTDVDNMAKFIIDCMKKSKVFVDDKKIKQLYAEKIRCGKNKKEYIGINICKIREIG